MTTFTMDSLGGFLRVGPQAYAENPNGVPVIQRGPHGMYLSRDPVVTREHERSGSGFRFWVEQLNVPADESWTPEAKVVGLLGMGDAPPCPKWHTWAFGAVALGLAYKYWRRK